MTSNLENTVYDMKRLVGKRLTNANVQNNLKYWPFKVVSGELGRPLIEVRHQGVIVQKRAEDISAEVLKKMCHNAQLVLRCPVKKAVITVPAYFDQAQKAATITAANKAGLRVLELITEPAAAAFAYGFDNKECNNCTLLFRVVGLGGDTNLGGRDIDNSLLTYFENKIKAKCEELKVCLSSSSQDSIYLGDLFADVEDDLVMNCQTFAEICAPLFQKTIDITKKTIEDAGLKPDDIDEILLVGGSSRIPKLQQMLTSLFQNKKLNTSINLDEAVAYGAALRAAQLSKNEGSSGPNIVLVEATPLSLGIAISGDRFTAVIPQNSIIEVYEAGSVLVEINFDLNKNGLLKVTASHGDRIQTLELDYTIEREDYQTIDDARYLAEQNKEKDSQEYELVSGFVDLDVDLEKARFQLSQPLSLSMAQKEMVLSKCNAVEKWAKEKRDSANIQQVKDLRKEFAEFCKSMFEKRYVPSIVTVKRGKRLIGLPALNTIPSNIIFDACQMNVGSHPTNQPVSWHANSTNYQYTLKDANNEHILRQQEVIAMVLDHLKTVVAEKQLGCVVQKAVICVPSFADNLYRSTVMQAAEIAGFKEVRLLNQSTAVAMAFKMDHLGVASSSSTHKKPAADIKFAVVNIGANCTEASVFNIRAVDGQVQLLSTFGDANVGGEHFTNCLVEVVLGHLHKRPNKDENMLSNKKSIKIVRDACEKAKIDLSSFSETGIFIDIFGTEYDVDKFRRVEFEASCSSSFEQVEDIIAKGLSPHSHQISSLLLVGGASRMPKIKHIVAKYISSECQLVTGIVAEEAAVIGTAVQASLLTGHSTLAHAFVHDFAYKSVFAVLPEVRIKILDRCNPIPTIRTRQPNICTAERQELAVQLITDTNEMLGTLSLKTKSSLWVNLDSNGINFINFIQPHSQPQLAQYPSLFKPNGSDLQQAKLRIQQYMEGISNTKSDFAPKQICPKEGVEHKKPSILEQLEQKRKEKEEEKNRKGAIQAILDQQVKEFEEQTKARRQKQAIDKWEQEHSAMQTKKHMEAMPLLLLYPWSGCP
uniref:Uncharacterized protein n=1 Tax=Ditylenchus dipsaci TaxID=166011 RepID=A0A915CVN6_9BILA